ncbi:unnamed protein product [Haemonchus placei]|uniref:Uncharacterized protein n=1 Tax=Haemonchus placei TaxID=6290 RepID=A0A0N4VXJ9_HAEPC|nr:unnamed protein product [Haemonchus placei]
MDNPGFFQGHISPRIWELQAVVVRDPNHQTMNPPYQMNPSIVIFPLLNRYLKGVE